MRVECYPVDTSGGRVWQIRDAYTHRPICDVTQESDAHLIVRGVNTVQRQQEQRNDMPDLRGINWNA